MVYENVIEESIISLLQNKGYELIDSITIESKCRLALYM